MDNMIRVDRSKDLSGRNTNHITVAAPAPIWRGIWEYLNEAGFGEWSAKPKNEAAFDEFWAELEAIMKEDA